VKKCPFYTIIGLVIGATTIETAHAQLALDATTGARNQFVYTMVGLNPYDKPVFQGDLWWTLPSGLWADIWWNSAMDFHPGFNREVDYGFGWMNDFIKVGGYYFDIHELLGLEPIGDVAGVLVEGWYNWEIADAHVLKPYAQANVYASTADPSNDYCTLSHGGAQYTWTPAKAFAVKQDLSAVYDSGLLGGDHGLIGRYSIVATARLSKKIALSAPLLFTVPMTDSLQDRKTEMTFGLDVVISHMFIEPPKEDE
jgi:hypothetical protein